MFNLCKLSFLIFILVYLAGCNSNKQKDLSGFYLDEFGIDLLEVKEIKPGHFQLSNQNSSLEMQRHQDTLKGLVKTTGNQDTIYFRFITQDSVVHELWGNQTSYLKITPDQANQILNQRSTPNKAK